MQSLSKSLAVGAAAGIATYFASQAAMGYTSAFAMPADFPLQVWRHW